MSNVWRSTDEAQFDDDYSAMDCVLDRLKAGSPVYTVEMAGNGYVLVAAPLHYAEFSRLVRDLLDHDADEFVILPVTDGGDGYDRAIILPFDDCV